MSGAVFVALGTAGIAFGTALGNFGLHTGDGSKGSGTWLRVSVSAQLARCAGLTLISRLTRLAFATWLIFAAPCDSRGSWDRVALGVPLSFSSLRA